MSRQSAGLVLDIANTFKIDGVEVTATATELNLTAGLTATTTELNKLDDSLVDLTTVDATALEVVGRIHTAIDGKAYVYLQGVASVAIGSCVTYIVTTPAVAVTKLSVVSGVGLVAIAMAAIVAGKFGWFQIAGLNLVALADSSAAIGQAYLGGTTGSIDSTKVVGDMIIGMHITVAEASNMAGIFMTYPSVSNDSN